MGGRGGNFNNRQSNAGLRDVMRSNRDQGWGQDSTGKPYVTASSVTDRYEKDTLMRSGNMVIEANSEREAINKFNQEFSNGNGIGWRMKGSEIVQTMNGRLAPKPARQTIRNWYLKEIKKGSKKGYRLGYY